jgi:hypothetical protein
MARAILSAVAVALVARSAFAQAPPRDAARESGTGIIRGRVVLAGTDQPLARVDVRASSGSLRLTRRAKTDDNGRYEFAELPAGRYVVTAAKPNFVTAAFGQRRPLGPALPFDLADNQIAARVDFALARSGVIAGRILDELGDPASEVQVTTMRYSYVNGERRLTPAAARAATNDLGEFRLFGLPPGDYFVAATLSTSFNTAPDERTGYSPTYYPGTGNVAQAQRISIAPGQSIVGIAMALLPVHTSRISGIVLDASGSPRTDGMVFANARIGMMGMGTTTAYIRGDGRFEIAGLTPGDYVLRAAGGADGSTAVLPITVGDADVSDVQLVAAPLTTLSGRITFDAAAGRPRASAVSVTAQRADPMLGVGAPLGGAVKDDGTFEIKVLSGRAMLRAPQPSPDWRLKRVTVDGTDVTDSFVDLPPGLLSNVVVEFTNKLSDLSGTVVDAADAAIDAWVVVFPQDPRRWVPPSRFVAATRPDRDNRFRTRLLAGDYYAIVVDDVEVGEWSDPEYLGRIRERATPFSIGEGETKSVELKLSTSR